MEMRWWHWLIFLTLAIGLVRLRRLALLRKVMLRTHLMLVQRTALPRDSHSLF